MFPYPDHTKMIGSNPEAVIQKELTWGERQQRLKLKKDSSSF